MRSTILEHLKTGLIAAVGTGSSYTELQVESIESRIPEVVGVNKFIGLTIDDTTPFNVEIGHFLPSVYEYECKIALLVKNGDYIKGQDELDRIVNRIIKYLNVDIFAGLSETQDAVTERVQGYSVENIGYTSGNLKLGEIGHIAIITLKMKTDLSFN